MTLKIKNNPSSGGGNSSLNRAARKVVQFFADHEKATRGILWTNVDLSIELGYSASGQALYVAARCPDVMPYTMVITDSAAAGCAARTRLWGLPEDIAEAKKRGW